MGNQQSDAKGGSSSSSSSSSSNSTNYSSTQSNGTGTMLQARKPASTLVTLNIYEPSSGQSGMPGFGIYHTGIEIGGVEYSFAGAANAPGSGVITQQPRATPEGGQWKFKQALELGSVSMTRDELERVLSDMRTAFPANTYDLVHRNCNSFTLAVAKRLNVAAKYPGWVNRAAAWGAAFSSAPKHLQNAPPVPQAKESVFKTTTGYKLDGSTVPAKKPAKSESKKADVSEKKSAEKKPSAAATSSGSARRPNPWADPNFIPPGMRSDPVVAGAVPPQQSP